MKELKRPLMNVGGLFLEGLDQDQVDDFYDGAVLAFVREFVEIDLLACFLDGFDVGCHVSRIAQHVVDRGGGVVHAI